jgi:hypothetical protein
MLRIDKSSRGSRKSDWAECALLAKCGLSIFALIALEDKYSERSKDIKCVRDLHYNLSSTMAYGTLFSEVNREPFAL